jgi:hypothetical protein
VSEIANGAHALPQSSDLNRDRGLIEPTNVNHDLVVANVYQQPTIEENETVTPDADSHVEFTEYAYSRFEPRAAGTDPTIIRYPVQEPAHRYHYRGEGWKLDWTPKKAAGLFLATFAVFNAVGNAPSFAADTKEATESLWHKAKATVSSWLGHEQKPATHTVETPVPGERTTSEYTFREDVGESTPDPADVDKLLADIRAKAQNGTTVEKVIVFGGASDEWGPTSKSLTRPEAQNQDLAIDRAADFASATIDKAIETGTPMPNKVETGSSQSVLPQATVDGLKSEAGKHNLSLDRALAIYNSDPTSLPDSLRAEMDKHIGAHRAIKVSVTYKAPDTTKTETVVDEQTPVSPENKDHDYDLYWGIPTPVWPRRRREDFMATRYEEWLRPGTDADHRWVELYKEALNDDGTLPRDAWALTRKYQLLMREDRIDYVLTHRYTDKAGEERDIRVMFVDHDPTDATIATYKELLTALSEMREGNVAEQLSAITVFPTDQSGIHRNAGRTSRNYPHHPKDIGLGIDKQEPRGVVGIATPALGLVEMHMPEDPTEEELRGYDGAFFTAAHEVAAHFTDTTEEPTVLTQVGPTAVRHYVASDPWEDVAAEVFDQYLDIDAEGDYDLTITRQVVGGDGQIITLTDQVKGDDPRLGESQHAVLHNRKPNLYAGVRPAELYGEVGGQVVSRALIPYEVAGLDVTARHESLGRGYAVDPELQKFFEDRTGWSPNNARPVNDDEFTLTTALDDPLLRSLIDTARRAPMPDDRITILSGVATRKVVS